MMIVSFAACAPKNKPQPDNGKGNVTDQTPDKNEGKELEGSLITEKPTKFTIFLNFNNMPFNPEWRVWQEIAKRTNISLEGVISQSNSNEQEAFNLMVSSGKLADIIGYVDASELEKLGRDGGILPLNDLIKEHAPNIQAALDRDERFRQTAVSLDGNIYQIPKNQELITAEFWWIRQDWLTKLGLEVPKTVDDLYNVLTAFRNEDPNGNGQKDEIPLFDRAGHKMPDEYLYLWDTSLEFYPRNGKMTFEPMEENFKTGVQNIVKWYKEGLIDPEIFTRGPKARDILLSGNLGGVTHDWPSAGNYNTTLTETIPGFEMVAFAPPADQHGVVKERTARYPGVGWSISSQCKDPVTVIKFMDYFFTEEGSDLVNWGIEGETYVVNPDGTKSYTDVVMNSDQTPIGYLRSLGVQYRIGMEQNPAYEYAFMTPAAKAATELYEENREWFEKDMPPYLDGALALKYTPEDEAEYKKIMSSIRPYVNEKFQSWMLGTTDFNAEYDSFIAELKTRGIEKAIEINQRAYETFLGK
ncbi:MAG: extracellular solute-binding protein [Epulopiscium sp.]|nr:extracellular solute-binding protein [Candidatus Epulonipiscium sp.]